jgi:RNA polymerase sigma factor (sigma-70 family)
MTSAPHPVRSSDGPSDVLRRTLLVLRAQAGDEAAFAELMRLFGDSTLRYLHGLVGDDAEDVFQETWLAVFRQLKTLHDPSAFQVWLFRTARHRAFNWLRHHRRERELLADVPLDVLTSTVDDPAMPDALESIDAARLDAAMREMPPPQREVLILRFRDDLSYAQIAQVTAVPIGTVRARLHYAKKRLAHLLNLGAPQ